VVVGLILAVAPDGLRSAGSWRSSLGVCTSDLQRTSLAALIAIDGAIFAVVAALVSSAWTVWILDGEVTIVVDRSM
jgi:hypothetical protein